mmetsp:Transcript_88024/g.139905  ORF Transcript_88024/g.139905 Transcript_88024/m.139905 type:complete len:206 (-) Transcript_88024:156-773(-)
MPTEQAFALLSVCISCAAWHCIALWSASSCVIQSISTGFLAIKGRLSDGINESWPFFCLNFGFQRLGCLTRLNCHHTLYNDGTSVDLLCDQMHSAATFCLASIHYSFVHFQIHASSMFRKQTGMDVDTTPFPVFAEFRADDTHEATHHHKFHSSFTKNLGDFSIIFSTRSTFFAGHMHCLHSFVLAPLQDSSILLVRNHHHNLCV